MIKQLKSVTILTFLSINPNLDAMPKAIHASDGKAIEQEKPHFQCFRRPVCTMHVVDCTPFYEMISLTLKSFPDHTPQAIVDIINKIISEFYSINYGPIKKEHLRDVVASDTVAVLQAIIRQVVLHKSIDFKLREFERMQPILKEAVQRLYSICPHQAEHQCYTGPLGKWFKENLQ